jgi:glycine oxidase
VSQTPDVIVVGGGPVGLSCACELAQTGRKILVLEAGEERGEAWRAAAGMLAAQAASHQQDPLLELSVAGRERYAELGPILLEQTGVDIGLQLEGIARVAGGDEEATALRATVGWQRQQGHLCDWYTAAEVRTRWPWLGPTHGCLWAPRDGALDPIALVQALRAQARHLGVTTIRDRVVALERLGDRVGGVRGSSSYVAADVVIAAGAWSREITGLPRPISVEPIRGQMAALNWPPDVPPAIVIGRSAYLVPRAGEALLGSTMEHAGFAPDVSAAGLAQIFTGTTALCPALAGGDVLRTWAGLRPVTPDGLPIVGREPELEGLWYATGHGRNGILLAAVTGVLLAHLINGDEDPVDLTPLRPERFWNWQG